MFLAVHHLHGGEQQQLTNIGLRMGDFQFSYTNFPILTFRVNT
jgi:hypothetical protein